MKRIFSLVTLSLMVIAVSGCSESPMAPQESMHSTAKINDNVSTSSNGMTPTMNSMNSMNSMDAKMSEPKMTQVHGAMQTQKSMQP